MQHLPDSKRLSPDQERLARQVKKFKQKIGADKSRGEYNTWTDETMAAALHAYYGAVENFKKLPKNKTYVRRSKCQNDKYYMGRTKRPVVGDFKQFGVPERSLERIKRYIDKEVLCEDKPPAWTPPRLANEKQDSFPWHIRNFEAFVRDWRNDQLINKPHKATKRRCATRGILYDLPINHSDVATAVFIS